MSGRTSLKYGIFTETKNKYGTIERREVKVYCNCGSETFNNIIDIADNVSSSAPSNCSLKLKCAECEKEHYIDHSW